MCLEATAMPIIGNHRVMLRINPALMRIFIIACLVGNATVIPVAVRMWHYENN
jgi:hypothetical protein